MWKSKKEVKVTEMSYEVSSVIDVVGGSHLLRRCPKNRMTEVETGNPNIKVSRDAIPMPWIGDDPKSSDDESLNSSVSDNSNKRVVVELQWLDKESKKGKNVVASEAETVASADGGIKASLTLTETDKVDKLKTHLVNDSAKDTDSLKGGRHSNAMTPGKVLNTDREVTVIQTDSNSAASVTTSQADSQPNTINPTTIAESFNIISTHETAPEEEEAFGSSLPLIGIHRYNKQDPDSVADTETPILPSAIDDTVHNDTGKAYGSTNYKTASILSLLTTPPMDELVHEASTVSAEAPSLETSIKLKDSPLLMAATGIEIRPLMNAGDDLVKLLPVTSRGIRDLKLDEIDIIPHTTCSLLADSPRYEVQMARGGSPFTGSSLILPEIEEVDRWGDIVDEIELLTIYHGAGVLCPLTTDDVPESSYLRMDLRRGRSVSVMRRLLSDGSGQFSRETTPMSDLRRRFKVKMKVTNLHEAAVSGEVKDMKSLLDAEEVDIDATDEKERTSLHMAADRGHLNVVTLLIEKGCTVSPTDVDKRTPLHCAVESGDVGVVSALLAAGADVEIREKNRGRTPIHLATVANSLDVLRVLLQPLIDDPWAGRRVLKLADKDGRTLLHMTAHHGLQEATSLLLSAGAEVNATDFSGNTPMHAVILTRLRKRERLCAPVLEILLDSGGDVEGAGEDGVGEDGTLLHAAASVGCLECLEVLVKRSAQMEAKDFFGKTPLHIAIEEEHAQAVSFLLEHKASMEEVDSRGMRALHHAIMANSQKLVQDLLVAGADKTSRDRDGKTYFQFALLKRRYQALDSLIKNGVTDVGDDQLPSHYCASVGNQAALDVLVNNGYDLNETDKEGRTALHHAISSGHESLVLYLLANGCSTRRADNNGATPLHYAVRWGGSDALLRLLVKKKGIVGAVDRLGRTPLHYAASKSAIMSDMYILINSGAQLNTKDDRGLTPLHLAARLGNESLVRILLDNEARHDIRDCDDFLPIDHAKENGHKCIIKRLEAYNIKKGIEKDARLSFYVLKKEGSEELI